MNWIFKNGRLSPLILFSGLLSTGILSGTMIKFQQRSVVNGVQFNHPFMQTLMMFLGEMLCYVCFLVYKLVWKKHYLNDRQEEEEKQGKAPKISKFLFIIPALLDFVGSSITLLAMSMMPFSVYYMMRGGGVIIIAILSVLCLKADLERQNYLGLLLNFFGFLVVGISAILTSSTDKDTTYIIFGIVLILVSLFTSAFQLVFEQRFFMKYSLNPLEEMGWEGIWGTLFNSLALIALVQIPCPEIISNCPDGKLESLSLFFSTLTTMEGTDQPSLLYLVIFSIPVLMMMNGFSMCVTKYYNAINKTMVSAVSPFIVWIITIWLKWDEFNFGQFAGYVIITLGTLIYTEVLVIPFWGFNKNLKKDKNKVLQLIQQIKDIKSSRRSHLVIQKIIQQQQQLQQQASPEIKNLSSVLKAVTSHQTSPYIHQNQEYIQKNAQNQQCVIKIDSITEKSND